MASIKDKLRKVALYKDAIAQAIATPEIRAHLRRKRMGFVGEQNAYQYLFDGICVRWGITPYLNGTIGLDEFLNSNTGRWSPSKLRMSSRENVDGPKERIQWRYEICKDIYDTLQNLLKDSSLKIKNVT